MTNLYDRQKPYQIRIVYKMNNLNIKDRTLVGVFNKSVETVIIPEGVRRLENGALKGCKNLKEIVLPESLREIGRDVFWGCKSLEKVVLPSGVRSYGSRIFWACSKLRELTIQNLVGYTKDSFEGGHTTKCTLYIPSSNYAEVISFHEFGKYKEIKQIEVNNNNSLEFDKDILRVKEKIEDYYTVYLEVFRRVLVRFIDETTDERLLYNGWDTKEQAKNHLETDLPSMMGFTLLCKNESSYGKPFKSFYSLKEVLSQFELIKEDVSKNYNNVSSVSLALCIGNSTRNHPIEKFLWINTLDYSIRLLPLKKNTEHIRWGQVVRVLKMDCVYCGEQEYDAAHFKEDIDWKNVSANLFQKNEFVWFTPKEEVDNGYVDIFIRENGRTTTWIHRKRGPEDEGQGNIRFINKEESDE